MTVNKSGIVRLTIQHDLIVGVSFMYYQRDSLRPTSADVLSLGRFPMYRWQSCDFGWRTPQFIPVNKKATADRHIAHRGAVGTHSNLQLYPAEFILSLTNMLAANYSIVTWSELYNRQNFPLLFIIVFLSNSTPANHGYTTTSAWSEQIQIQPIGRPFV